MSYNNKNDPLPTLTKKITKSFWAEAWNKNLENYTDFFKSIGGFSKKNEREYNSRQLNRLSRIILNTEIEEGLVKAVAMGYANNTYDIKITVRKMSPEKWNYIVGEIGHEISNVRELVSGKFPQDLADKLLSQESGLFPSSEELQIQCSCGKQADICTHSALALYGIGLKFDEDPLLFFKLRGVPFGELLEKTVDEKVSDMIANAQKASDRAIADEDIFDIFGIAVN